ncbi:MAG: hypothetical protein AAF570_26855 [Bacteroidota bacterium]
MEDLNQEIDRYLDGDMSGAEAAAFEARMTSDPALAEAVREAEDVRRALRVRRHQQLGETVRRVRERMLQRRQRRMAFALVGAAASVVLVVGLFWMMGGASLAERGDAAHRNNPFLFEKTLGAGQNAQLYRGERAQQEGELARARQHWDSIPTTDQLFVPAQLYIAQAFLFEEKPDSSMQRLEKIRSKVVGRLKPGLYWLSAISELKRENKTEALQHLDQLLAETRYLESDLEATAKALRNELASSD